jgi:hypothetical protein
MDDGRWTMDDKWQTAFSLALPVRPPYSYSVDRSYQKLDQGQEIGVAIPAPPFTPSFPLNALQLRGVKGKGMGAD